MVVSSLATYHPADRDEERRGTSRNNKPNPGKSYRRYRSIPQQRISLPVSNSQQAFQVPMSRWGIASLDGSVPCSADRDLLLPTTAHLPQLGIARVTLTPKPTIPVQAVLHLSRLPRPSWGASHWGWEPGDKEHTYCVITKPHPTSSSLSSILLLTFLFAPRSTVERGNRHRPIPRPHHPGHSFPSNHCSPVEPRTRQLRCDSTSGGRSLVLRAQQKSPNLRRIIRDRNIQLSAISAPYFR
ncbi:hypothetical protein QBC38DRAFT_104970 [Podospora fimiseda]|uniref:Uncharacterized protein n=1 Tax=Podospora fimiseda TaxID=252190 RepID=A0AAN7BTT4_9PEZI|nr:hypothetical protein QBC38DRAFT_104970 [Podospora fimiseda]